MAQEDARQFKWTAPGAIALDGPPIDLARQRDQDFVLRLEWRVEAAGDAPVRLAVDGAPLDMGKLAAPSQGAGASVVRIPLRCFVAAGADLADVGTPVRISAGQGFSMVLRDARIEAVGETVSCPG